MKGFIFGNGQAFNEPAGTSKHPVYVDADGIIRACEDTLDIKIDGVAAKVEHTEGNSFYISGYDETTGKSKYNKSVSISNGNVLMGAAWNDYAESRSCIEEPGTCVCEDGKGNLIKSTQRLQAGASIVSDTYGVLIGLKGAKSAPVAVAGRVLAYLDNNINIEDINPGDAVCASEGGKVSIMTREEIINWPDRIVGFISEIPDYNIWNDVVEVKGRVWVKVK